MQREIDDLRVEVAQLRAQQSESWLNQQRTEEVRAVVRDVIAASQSRPTFGNTITGYNDKGFYIAASPGYLLRVGAMIQFRYIADHRASGPGIDTQEGGFQLRRIKLRFEGNVISPELDYRVQFDADRDSGGVVLQDAWLRYHFSPELFVIAGQFQDFYSREQMTSSRRLMGIERSVAATIFASSSDYVQGVGLQWDATDRLRLDFTVNDGVASGAPGGGVTGTGFLNPGHDFYDDSTRVAVTGRAELRVAGDWSETQDLSAWPEDAPALFVGTAVHEEIGKSPRNTTPQIGAYDSFLMATADVVAKYRGLTVLAAGYTWHFDLAEGNAHGASLDNYAATLQAAYQLIPERLEPYVKYDWIHVDPSLTDANELNTLTAGFNYYFRRHALRLSADVLWAMNNVNTYNTLGTNLSGLGLLPDAAGRSDQIVGRAQIQVMF
jgi:hypothetical protein